MMSKKNIAATVPEKDGKAVIVKTIRKNRERKKNENVVIEEANELLCNLFTSANNAVKDGVP